MSVLAILVAAGTTTSLVLAGSSANADPSAHTWHRLRTCESSDNYRINTGNGYYGAYQFDLATWRSVGGNGLPNRASKPEQDARALILYRERGWQPWTCASILGLREDSDARSGRTGDIHVGHSHAPAKPHAPVQKSHAPRKQHRAPTQHPPRKHVQSAPPKHPGAIPTFPSKYWYTYGDDNRHIKTFQDEMHRRGYFPVGTGQYGPNTRRMVKRLQRLNGLNPNGYIGPNTWRLAWTGKYSNSAHARAIPDFPSKHWYYFGANNRNIKTFQDQMHRRGYFPVGTGQYGPNTLRMVKQLQRLNGLVPNGAIGPNTWRLAWIGKYHT
jgi:peptidoglycan hydrolase-like protein with peptidoglycan-binding domain